MTTEAIAPRAFNREMYHDHRENVFYGTDDGAQDGSGRELAEIEAHYDGVEPWRRENIHMISVVGGLYGLNLIPLWKPKRITIGLSYPGDGDYSGGVNFDDLLVLAKHYNAIVEFTEGKDPVTNDMVIDILRDEEGHRRLFEGFLREYEAEGKA